MGKFDAASYWEERLHGNVSLEKVGFLGLGKNYNSWLYRVRSTVFRRTVKSLGVDLAKSSVLDIGSGTGFYVRLWSLLGAKEVVGLDITTAAVEHLRRQFSSHRFYQADITETPTLPGGATFDVVSAFDVLFHVVDDLRYREAIANIHGLLRPGGWFLHSDIFVHGQPARGTHYAYRRLLEVEQLLRDTGFEILARKPMFVLMNVPVDSDSRLRKLAWGAVQKAAGASALTSYLAGAALFPLEVPLTAILKESASTEVMICRKVDK